MLTCIAIDDEPLALELLEDNISKLPYLHLAASCSNALEALKILEQQPADLIFLDIQMPGLTGLQFIQSITQKPMFILITAYEKYALQGFNLDVVDYLLKPVALERFIKACNKAKDLYDLRMRQKEHTGDAEPDYFFINVDYSLMKLVYADIMYIEGLKDYMKIYLHSSTKPVIARMSMKAMEEQLPAAKFMRVHKSYIVSKNFITAIRKNNIFIEKIEIPVGDTYKDSLLEITGKQTD